VAHLAPSWTWVELNPLLKPVIYDGHLCSLLWHCTEILHGVSVFT